MRPRLHSIHPPFLAAARCLYSSTSSADLTGQTEIHGTVKVRWRIRQSSMRTSRFRHFRFPTRTTFNLPQRSRSRWISARRAYCAKTEIRGPGGICNYRHNPGYRICPNLHRCARRDRSRVVQMFAPDIASSDNLSSISAVEVAVRIRIFKVRSISSMRHLPEAPCLWV
jgi:hypothetical protein